MSSAAKRASIKHLESAMKKHDCFVPTTRRTKNMRRWPKASDKADWFKLVCDDKKPGKGKPHTKPGIKAEKGVYSLISIFKKLKSKENKISLTIIGSGNKFENKTEGVTFLDPISSKKQLIDHYDQNHIFV